MHLGLIILSPDFILTFLKSENNNTAYPKAEGLLVLFVSNHPSNNLFTGPGMN